LLTSDQREILNLSLPNQKGDRSAAIIVPAFYNKKRTDRKSEVHDRPSTFNYIDELGLGDCLEEQVMRSAQNVLGRDFNER
jgi:hypothetical protein